MLYISVYFCSVYFPYQLLCCVQFRESVDKLDQFSVGDLMLLCETLSYSLIDSTNYGFLNVIFIYKNVTRCAFQEESLLLFSTTVAVTCVLFLI